MSISTLLPFIEACNNYLITFHQNPDGDAIGSALALHLAFRKLGKTGVVLSPNVVGEYLNWLPEYENVQVYESDIEKGDALVKEAKVIFCLDFNDLNRTGTMEHTLQKAKGTKVLIDHHLNPKNFAEFSYHDTHSPATALLIFEILNQIKNFEFTPEIATCLYTGLMTDTGSFRFPSTNANTHLAIAKLMTTGFDHAIIHENIFDTNTVNRLHLLGNSLVNRHEILPELNTSIIWVTLDDHKKFDIQKGDTEGFVNYNLSLLGVKFGALFIENEDMIKISFRSKGTFPANEFAGMYFQGGGHLNAAGGRSFLSLEKTIKRFKKKLSEFVQTHPF